MTNIRTELKTDECWSLDESEFRYSSLGDLLDGNWGDLEVGRVVYVGDQVPADSTGWFDADDLNERLAEVAYDTHGECAEDWPGILPKEANDEFDAFVAAWIAKHCPPDFYGVENIRPYTLTAEDLKDE